MADANRKPPIANSFLFVHKDAKNIHRRGHLGAVNAHVHAVARAKKNRKALQQQQSDPAASSTSLQSSVHSWRIGTRPNPADVEEPDDQGHDAPEGSKQDASSRASESPPLSMASLCHSPSTVPESGPSTPQDVPVSLTIQVLEKRPKERQTGLQHRQSSRARKPPKGARGPETVPKPEPTVTTPEPTVTEAAISAYLGSQGLDPFCQLPAETAPREQNLIHYYLSAVGGLVYGTRPDAMFCPVRDVTFVNASKHPLVLQWVIIGSEAYLAARQGLPEPATLFRRKVQVYREMNDKLSHPVERCSEGTFIAITGAIIIDSRAIGAKVASMHLRGLEMLVRHRGGLESFYRENPSTYGVFFFVWAHHMCNGGGVAHLAQLNLYQSNFLQTLRDLQSWNQKYRHDVKRLHVRRLWHGGAHRSSKSEQSSIPRNDDTLLEDYVSSWTKAFSSTSVLRPMIDPDYPCSDIVESACHFSNIYTLNLTLWTFREDPAIGASFLNRILRHMEENGTKDPITGLTSLTLSALVWMLRKARVEVDHGSEQSQEREVWMSWKIIHTLKVRALLDHGTLIKLTRIMSSWLTEEDLQNATELSEEDICSIGQEVIRNWEASPD